RFQRLTDEKARGTHMRDRSIFRIAIVLLAATAFLAPAIAADPGDGQRTFATPLLAARALLAAAETDNMPALSRLFGPGADEILNSGDVVADANDRARFVKRAKQSLRTRIDPHNPNRATLLIGADNSRFAIPLVKSAGRWQFDTAAGKTEVTARRIS